MFFTVKGKQDAGKNQNKTKIFHYINKENI